MGYLKLLENWCFKTLDKLENIRIISSINNKQGEKMNTNYQAKHTAIEAYAIMQQMAITSKMTIQQLAEANGCKCGYELQKKILADLNNGK